MVEMQSWLTRTAFFYIKELGQKTKKIIGTEVVAVYGLPDGKGGDKADNHRLGK